jgi:hypothetical protein
VEVRAELGIAQVTTATEVVRKVERGWIAMRRVRVDGTVSG